MTKLIYPSFLILLCLILFFFRLGALGLTDPDEARFAESAREMLELKSPVVPYFNYEPRINKPILFYWFLCLSYIMFGVNELAARLPSAFFATLGVFLTYKLAKNLFDNKRIAFLSGCILAGSLEYTLLGRLCTIDMMLTFFIILALFSFHFGYIKLFYTGLALAFLAKGPVGVIVPFLIISVFLALTKNIKDFRKVCSPSGILIFFVITAPWYILCYINQLGVKGSIKLLQGETLKRFFAGLEHPEPVYYFIPVVVAGFLPWIFFLPQSVTATLNNIFRNSNKISYIFLLSWAGVVFVFFSISRDKLASYILPMYPALAIMLGAWWNAWIIKYKKGLHIFFVILVFLIMFTAFSLKYILPEIEARKSTKQASLVLSNIMQADDKVISFRIFKPSMVFYLKRKLKRIDEDSELISLFKSPQRIFVYVNKKDLPDIKDRLGVDIYTLAEQKKIAIVSNKP